MAGYRRRLLHGGSNDCRLVHASFRRPHGGCHCDAHHYPQSVVACRIVGVGYHAVAGRYPGRRTPSIVDGHQPAHHTIDGTPGQRRVLPCAAIFDGLARQQLRRLDCPPRHARDVGGGPDGRHTAAGFAASIIGAGRQCARAGFALALDGPDRGHWARRSMSAFPSLCP